VYAPGPAVLSQSTASGSNPSPGARSRLIVEIAAPLVVRDASIIWPIRRNLVINCSGALALYGESRLRELLAAVGAGSPDEIRQAILTSASAFLGTATPRDDVTLAVAKFT
jgi:hypothetical protein